MRLRSRSFNGGMIGLIAAHSHRAVMIDINNLLAGVVEAGRYVIADWEINRGVASNDPRHLFLADGFHPGTIGQCLIANRFLEAINRVFDAGIPMLGDGEMVRFAASVPKPSGLSLFGTGVLALLGHGVVALMRLESSTRCGHPDGSLYVANEFAIGVRTASTSERGKKSNDFRQKGVKMIREIAPG